MGSDLIRATRPHFVRAGLGLVMAIAGMVLASFGQLRGNAVRSDKLLTSTDRSLVVGGALLVLIGGIIAVRATARAMRGLSKTHVGDARGASLGFLCTVVGYSVVLLLVLSTLNVPLGGLLLGGAITGVVLGIAAQQTLGNFFAGLVLLINRPFTVGEHIVLRSGPLGGEYDGHVTDISLFYVSMVTENGPVALPNASVLMSAVGPGAKAPTEEDEEPVPQGAGGAPDHSKGTSG